MAGVHNALLAITGKLVTKEQIFTASGTFTIPAGVSKLHIVAIGGGGGAVDTADIRGGQGQPCCTHGQSAS